MSIGRVGGNGARPPWRPNPSESSASVSGGISSGSASMPRSTTFLPGRPGTAELPMCSTTVPGRADAIRRASSRATSTVRGSHGVVRWAGDARRDGWAGPTSRASVGERARGAAAMLRRERGPHLVVWLPPSPRSLLLLAPGAWRTTGPTVRRSGRSALQSLPCGPGPRNEPCARRSPCPCACARWGAGRSGTWRGGARPASGRRVEQPARSGDTGEAPGVHTRPRSGTSDRAVILAPCCRADPDRTA